MAGPCLHRRTLLGAVLGLSVTSLVTGAARAQDALDVEARRIIAEHGGVLADARIATHVATVLDGLAAAAGGGTFSATILDSPAFNALALPDGRLFIARGLVALAADSAGLAAVLAHEMAHVIARHAAARAARLGITDELAAIVGVPADAAALAFTRQQELEADAMALELLRRVGWDPGSLAEMVVAVAGMAAMDGLPAADPRHPGTEERLARLPGASGGTRERDRHLDAIDGLRWGEAVGRPALRGRLVIDSVGPVRWQAPAGWPLMPNRLGTVALGPGEAAIAHDAITQPGAPSAEIHLSRLWGPRLGITAAQRVTVGGFPAAVATTALRGANGNWEAQLAVIETTPERRDRFALACRAGSGLMPVMQAALETVGPPSAAELALAAPRRIAIVAAPAGDPVSGLAALMPPDLGQPERVRLLNGFTADRPPVPGARAKIVT